MKKQKTGLNRNTIDKFYTNIDIANECLNILKNTDIIDKEKDLIIEPSAGNGSFITGIKNLFSNYEFYDLEPMHDEIIKLDYLKFENKTHSKIHIVGNPPFGRQSSLAIKFIKKSCLFCNSISFILPKSFKKNSLKKHFPLSFHLIHESDIPSNSFLVNGNPHDVPCVFQIWEKRDMNRSVPKKLIPKSFKFVKKEEKHDISFRRVGVNAGKIDRNTENKSFQSHYFIKFDDDVSEEIYKKIESIQFDSNNTVGPKSISKQEVIKEFNKIIL